MKKSIIAIVAFLIFGSILTKSLPFVQKEEIPIPTSIVVEPIKVLPADYFSYTGEEGKDALTLLKEQAAVESDQSGLVTTINSRKADSTKREYWAFYVNGELAPVGPADYEMKEGDEIEWKIETY